MRILLTGGASDLAHVLAPQVLARGDTPVLMDIRPPRVARGELIAGSILDRPLLRQSLAGIDSVVHIAAWHGIHSFTGAKSVDDFWELNVNGTYLVFEEAARAGVRQVVYISSESVSDRSDVYGHTKVLGEEIAYAYSQRHQINVVTLRPRAFIPPWNREVYQSYVEWAKWFWGGAVHIDDVAQSVLLALDLLARQALAEPPVLTVDGAYDYSDADLAAWDQDGPGSTFRRYYAEFYDMAVGYGLDPAKPPTKLDMRETQRLLGYQPRFGLGNLLRELAQYGEAGPPSPA